MKRFFVVLIMILFLIHPAIAEERNETLQDEVRATLPFWRKCLEQSPNFSRLPTVDKELGPILTLPERMQEIAAVLLERMKSFDITKPSWQQMTPQERQQYQMLQKGHMLIQNCRKWTALEELSAIVLQSAGVLEQSWQSWEAYLEQQQIRNKVQQFTDLGQLTQQLKTVRQKMEQFDLTRDYYQQMSKDERQFLDDLEREIRLVAEFKEWLKNQKN